MMIALTAFLAISQASNDGAAKISAMLGNYYNAPVIVGKIVKTQTTKEYPDIKAVITTELQLDRKNHRLYLMQDMKRVNAADNRKWIVTANGKVVTYDRPNGAERLDSKKRLAENQVFEGKQLNIGDVYALSSKSLGDRSLPLDVIIGRIEDLRYVKGQLATIDKTRTETLSGESYTVVNGKWRDYETAPVTGYYEMWIDEKNNLKRFIHQETIGAREQPKKEKGETITTSPWVGSATVITTWELDVKTDAPLNEKLFDPVP
jgi:hypothetical protein